MTLVQGITQVFFRISLTKSSILCVDKKKIKFQSQREKNIDNDTKKNTPARLFCKPKAKKAHNIAFVIDLIT